MRNLTPSNCTINQTSLNCLDLLLPEELQDLEDKMVTVTFKRGETLCKQGAFASHIMVIHEGLVKIYMEGCADDLILQILPPQSIIGLSSIFEGNSVFYYSAQAYLDTKVSLIDMVTFKQLVLSNGRFAEKMHSHLAEHTVITYGRFYCFTQKQTFGRFADVLICLSNRIYKSTCIPLQLNRKELAELAGMSVESVARILTRFKEEKIIHLTSDFIEIIDMNKLKEICQKG